MMNNITENIKIINLSIRELKYTINHFDRIVKPLDNDYYKNQFEEYKNAIKSLEYEYSLLDFYKINHPEYFL